MNPPRPLIVHNPGLSSLRFAGPDSASFLHNQLSSDVEGMAVGDAGWTSYNSPKGRLLATPLLWRREDAEFVAYVPAELAEPLRKRLSMFVLRAKLTIGVRAPRFTAGVVGPDAAAGISAALGQAPSRGHGVVAQGTDVVALPDGRFLVDGEDALAIEGDDAQTALWDWLGVRAGVPQITLATQELFVAQAANLDLIGAVNFRKGCYPGQEIVARMQYLGRLKERLLAFHVEGDPPAPASRIVAGDDNAGTVVNAARAPAGGSELLAVVNLSARDAGALRLADGRAMVELPMPYEIPAPATPNRVKL
jgi:tRNA-modifying protein YgfZ